MKYSENFNRDFNWFLRMRHTFSFDGCLDYFDKKGRAVIENIIEVWTYIEEACKEQGMTIPESQIKTIEFFKLMVTHRNKMIEKK